MKYYALVGVFFIVAYLLPLAGRPMVTPDEFRYAEIPREMIDRGDYVTPHLVNMRYFEKPVMGYWMTVGCFKVFGENAFALRLPAALGGRLAALLAALLIQQTLHDEKIAALAAMLYLTFGMAYGIGTFAVLDSQLTGFVTGVSCTAFLAAVEPRFTRRKAALLVICGLFAAFAFLTKGFLAFVVPALAVTGFLLWERRWKEFLVLPWIPLAVALAVIAPWALAVHRADGDYWRYFVVVEHLQRFLSDSGEQHPEPFWFLIPFLVGGIFPAGFLLSAAIPGIRGERKTFFRSPLNRFCLCAVVLPFLFFSISSGKLPTYILPCFPFLAVLGAGGIAAYFRTGGTHRAFSVVMSVWGGCAGGGARGAGDCVRRPDSAVFVAAGRRRAARDLRAALRRPSAVQPALCLADPFLPVLRRDRPDRSGRRLGDTGGAAGEQGAGVGAPLVSGKARLRSCHRGFHHASEHDSCRGVGVSPAGRPAV